MNNQGGYNYSASLPTSVDVQPVLRLVYMWMGFGLLTTGVVAWLTASTPALLSLALNPVVMIGSMIASLVLVFVLSGAINRLSGNMAGALFFAYAALLGFTLSTIFLVYSLGSIANAFVTTAVMFGVMTAIGFTTNIDLSKFGSFLTMALIGLVVAMVINMFIGSSALDMVISMFGVVLFTGLTAYDTQRIKEMAAQPQFQSGGDMTLKVSIMGALSLYLNFINLFLFLLRLLGSRD